MPRSRSLGLPSASGAEVPESPPSWISGKCQGLEAHVLSTTIDHPIHRYRTRFPRPRGGRILTGVISFGIWRKRRVLVVL